MLYDGLLHNLILVNCGIGCRYLLSFDADSLTDADVSELFEEINFSGKLSFTVSTDSHENRLRDKIVICVSVKHHPEGIYVVITQLVLSY